MFIVETFEDGEWKIGSIHSRLVDAEMQLARFLEAGLQARLKQPEGGQ
jgi:hypothetical protein